MKYEFQHTSHLIDQDKIAFQNKITAHGTIEYQHKQVRITRKCHRQQIET